MHFTCTITINDTPYKHVKQLLAAELARKHDRSETTLTQKENTAQIHIQANDTAALRASINTITSILSMYEKTTQVIHDNK